MTNVKAQMTNEITNHKFQITNKFQIPNSKPAYLELDAYLEFGA
jgi:hypothetical protein